MPSNKKTQLPNLGAVEKGVMDHVWSHEPVSAEECRIALQSRWPMKESTMRTVLRRLEEKGYVEHSLKDRTYIYRATQPRVSVATEAVKQIIDRFCNGSAEELVLGMVDNAIIHPSQLEKLARKIAQRREQAKKE